MRLNPLTVFALIVMGTIVGRLALDLIEWLVWGRRQAVADEQAEVWEQARRDRLIDIADKAEDLATKTHTVFMGDDDPTLHGALIAELAATIDALATELATT